MLTHKCVRIQEYTFGVLGQSPALDFGEGDAKLWTSQQRQMEIIVTVH